MNRLTALAIAVVLIGGALFARGRITHHQAAKRTVLRLTCSPEMNEVCSALEKSDHQIKLTIEDAGLTADRLINLDAATDPGLDGWLVTGPWPQIVAEGRMARQAPALRLDATATGARSRVGFAVVPTRLAVLNTLCANAVDWQCLQLAASKGSWAAIPGGSDQWGPIKLGLSDPRADAVGLAALGAVTTSHFHKTDVSSSDFPGEFEGWLAPLSAAVGPSSADGPLRDMVVQQGSFDVAVTLEVIGTQFLNSHPTNPPTLIYPSPVVSAEVFLGTTNTTAASRLNGIVSGPPGSTALTNAGWTVSRSKTPSGEPDAGVLYALRSLWTQVHG